MLMGGNLIADFFSLLESRWILGFIKPGTPVSHIFGFLVVDLLASGLILIMGISLFIFLFVFVGNQFVFGKEVFIFDVPGVFTDLMKRAPGVLITSLFTNYTTSLWIFGYAISGLVLKSMNELEPLKKLVLWLDIKKQPVRAIGTVVSGFAFLISLGVAVAFA